MFKSKKNRDSVLLIIMALVMVAFLLYLFFPSNKSEKRTDIKPPGKKTKISVPVMTDNSMVESPDLFRALRVVLISYFNEVNTGDRLISQIPSAEIEKELRSSLEEKYGAELDKSLKYRLIDLERAVDVFKDTELSEKQQFDLYIALFLIRVMNEDIIGRCLNFTSDEIVSFLNLNYYDLIDNEVTENYHAIPVIVYTDILVKKIDIFSPGKEITVFSNALNKISDISPMQHINSVKDIFTQSKELRNFSFSWVEKDLLDPDDKGEYKNVTVRRRKFFKLQYLIFPDPGKGGDITWLRDLVNSDSGSIELSDLTISDETPGENYAAKSVIYSENTSRFIIVMDSPSLVSERGYISLMFKKKMERINTENNVINFAEKLYLKKEFRRKMDKFGKFLYHIRSVF